MAADAARIRELAQELTQKLVALINEKAGCQMLVYDPGGTAEPCAKTTALFEAELGRFAAAVERGGWVAVEERLPEMHEPYNGGAKCSARVLATEGRRVYICTYGETFEKRIPRWTEGGTFGRGLATVTHWRELPSPPDQV